MTDKKYKKKPGDFEIRVLSDGRIVFLGPDQQLMDMAKHITDTEFVYSKEQRSFYGSNQAESSRKITAQEKDGEDGRAGGFN